MHCDVHLHRVTHYEPSVLNAVLHRGMATLCPVPSPGSRVLIKPNLVAVRQTPVACTHPAVVYSLCQYFLRAGCAVQVGDSPAFGSAAGVARRCGYEHWLRDLDVALVTLDHPVRYALPWGAHMQLSRRALECDLLVNVGKLKAHGQMRLTACVKNMFGCVSGVRKAVAHARYGERGTRFAELLIAVAQALPHSLHVLDGITALHRWGPTQGTPLDFGLLGVSANGFALDTAVYTALGLVPEDVALWQEAQRQGIAASLPETLRYPAALPQDWQDHGFEVPSLLNPVSFRPAQLGRSLVRRICSKVRDTYTAG